MRLLEYQAKRILRENGITVPDGCLVTTSDDLNNLKLPVVLKAQVPVGGRGKAGGVKLVDNVDEAKDFAAGLLGTNLVTFQTDANGQPVNTVLVEETSDIAT